jgi:hypothetical protein
MMLQATRDIRKVALWLGHATLQSTEIYLRADPTEKLEMLGALAPLGIKPSKFPPRQVVCDARLSIARYAESMRRIGLSVISVSAVDST